jgi:hypothetical protein
MGVRRVPGCVSDECMLGLIFEGAINIDKKKNWLAG